MYVAKNAGKRLKNYSSMYVTSLKIIAIFLSYFQGSIKKRSDLFKVSPVHFFKSLCTIQIHERF